MSANINNSSLSGKLRKVSFGYKSLEKISNIIEKEFQTTTCKSRSFELVQIAKHHNLIITSSLSKKHYLKYNS